MCRICKKSPCERFCPNENTSFYEECTECGGTIYSGQEHYDLNGKRFHPECINYLTSTDILDVLEIYPEIY